MKNTPTQPIEATYSKFNTAKAPAKVLKVKPLPKTTTKKGRGKRIDSDVVAETEESTRTGAFQVYLNQIGTKPLLSREQEVALGSRIRAGFEALLQHLLSSGRVGDMLLEKAQAEMTRANCEPTHRSALGAAMATAGAFLDNARERFASGALENADLNAEVAGAFSDLVAVLEIWPGQCLELLAQVEREFSDLFPRGSTSVETAPQAEFARRNLMDTANCGTFLAGARRLRAAAVASRNEMVNANLRLVVSTAKRMKQSFLSFDDLVQEGNRGLLTAAERFDERLGNRFSTFAVKLIKSAMRRENDNQGRTIRLPVHRCDALRKLDGARAQIESEIHRAASVEQLSEETGFSCSEVRELSELKQGMISLDQDAGEEGEQKFGDFLPDPASLTPIYGNSDAAGSLDPYLEHLAEAQRSVVAYVYGIGGCPLLSLKETAERLGLEHAEVRRLHQSALGALRNAIPYQTCSHGYACAA
jgi:RNA polymerase sigma factor (sigma-70 family)